MPIRMIFLAAILFTWGTIEASEPNSWIPSITKDGENPSVVLKMNPPVIIPKEFNISWIIPKEFNISWIIPKEFKDGNIHPIPKNPYVLECGSHTINPGETVIIRSKNYPNKFPKKHTCQWDIEVSSPDTTISIHCPEFRLKKCKKSFVKITGGDFSKKYCKKNDGLSASSTTNSMTIVFKSKKARAKGFECEVTASDVLTTVPTTTETTTTETTTTEPPSDCKNCGTVNRATRIVGGEETEVNEYPWQSALVFAGTDSVFCGGSVYNDLYIITAAHCGQFILDNGGASMVEVLLGAHDVDNQQASVQRISVQQVLIHEGYDSNTLDNDIALLELSSAATLNDKVKPACLPDASDDYDNVNAIVSGWGTTSEGGSQPSSLMEVEVPTMPNSDCANTYGDYITENVICAGLAAGGKDSCQGDSGGPLATEVNGQWLLIGVVSFGYGCARPDTPGVYTRVTKYLPWLASNTADGSNTLCPSGGTTLPPPPPITTTPPPPPPPPPITTTPPPPPPPPITTTPAPPPIVTTASSSGCKCGHVNTNTRIVGGNPTEVHEYPWQVAMTGAYSNQPYCGGSIISDQWILTAAHCVDGQQPSNNRIVIGEHNWNSDSETTVTESREISQMIMHPDYDSQTQDNDLALVKLTSPIEFSTDNKIAPVCLPPSGELYEDVDAIVTGWGTLSSGGSQPNELYEVTVPTMTNDKCKSDLGNYGSYVTMNMICAGLDAGGKDSCQGDSGGPLVTSGDAAQTFMIQIGIVSWGLGCADAGSPGVYSRVNNYLDWIASTTSGSTTCPSS